MLHVQHYLRAGKTHQHLRDELGIRATFHDALPLVILNYDQLNSPKSHPIVRECRGLVLHTQTHDLVARAFPRFFNWGEMTDEMKRFDFSDFTAHTKEDGSLVLFYFFAGAWRASTRGSFAQDKFRDVDLTWHDAFARALGLAAVTDLAGRLDESLTYVCELCSPWNTVVRRYPEPVLYLLSAYRGPHELSPHEVDALLAGRAGALFRRPRRHDFTSVEDVRAFLQQQAATDPTFEGVVIRDRHGSRWKIKSATYLGLHQLGTEGPDAFSAKHLLPFILAGEADELLAYYPQIEADYRAMETKVKDAHARLAEVWEANWQIEGQKEFAQAIQGKTPFTGILFALRRAHGANQTRERLDQAWRDSAEMILKVLFKM
jgi:RNA ligase